MQGFDTSGRKPALPHLLISLALLLTITLACSLSLPNLTQNKPPSAAPTATGQAQLPGTAAAPAQGGGAKGPAVQLPPALVEVEPLPESALEPGAAPVFYFNQAMERASVEAAFQVTPAQGGKLEWLNDSTVRYVPASPAERAQGFDITISAGAKAANGKALEAPVAAHYPAAAPLRLAERLPAPDAKEVNPSSAVAVTFTQPVVALGADPAGLPAAFSLEPAAAGRGEWLNTSTYIFYPQPALLGGAAYSVRLNPALTSTSGAPLAADSALDWSFTTSAPVLLKVEPTTEQTIPLDSPFHLVFNQPMDTASVESHFSLSAPDGSPVQGAFSWNAEMTEVTFQPAALLERGADYSLVLTGEAHSQGGSAIGKNFAAVLSTVPQFAVVKTDPAAGELLKSYSGYGTILLTFSSPVAPGQDISSLVTITPAIGDQFTGRDTEGKQLFVSGFFQPSTSYTLTIAAGLSDRWGATLGAPFSFTFSSQAAEPTLVIPVQVLTGQMLFVPQNETALPARATNLSQVNLKRGQLSLSDFLRSASDYSGLQNWQPLVQAEWSLPLSQAPNQNEDIELPLTPDRSPLAPGLYFLSLDTQPVSNYGTNMPPSLMVVSPIEMVLKTTTRQAFVWAVRVEDQQPVAGAKADIYNGGGEVLASCTTDADGKCQVDLPQQEDPYRPLFAVLGQPGQPDFSLAASNWNQGVAPWEFRLNYEDPGGRPKVYTYTDRPIYRPGQLVNFRVIARSQDNGRYSPPPLDKLTVEVVGPYDPVTGQNQVLATLPLPLDAFGSAVGVYTLPEDARPGNYILRFQEVKFSETYFEVAEYRKPEIDLQVKFTEPNALVGKDLQAQLTASYFYGAPAGNLPVHWTLARSRSYLNLPDGLDAGPMDLGWTMPWDVPFGMEMFLTEGQGQTSPDGTLTIQIPGGDLRDRLESAAGQPQDLKLEVTVEDESGLPVSARDTTRLNPSPFYIGVRPEAWSVQAGDELTYFVRTVDWAGNPVADKPLTARFRKVAWKERDTTDPNAPPQLTPEYTDIGSTDFRSSERGEARLAFTPQDPGTYMLEITGEDGAITQEISWVGGPGSAPWPSLPNQRLQLRGDRGSAGQPGKYQPGETARIFIPNPFEGGATALVTVERGKVMSAEVIAIQGASYELDLPLTAEHAPNVYVSVILLGRTGDRPDFRMGYIELAVDPASQILQVEVQTSPEQPQPGGDVTLNIRVKDAGGQPVQGEFSLALIDKAVLALANPNSPSIIDAFYGRQPLGVQSSLSLVDYVGRLVYSPPGRGGGGGGADQTPLPVRSKFADTAFWSGTIQTDVTGVAQVSLTLPDNLTTWRADVRGLSGDARVGQAQVDVVVGKPLLISPVVPRFAVAGDHLELAAVVHNNTAGPLRASVRLETAGFTLEDPNQAAQPVDLQAGERRRISWWGTVQDLPSLDLTFSVESVPQAGEAPLRDATRPENNPLPVLRYSAPQTFGTTGVLSEAGERTELVSLPRSFTPTGGELSLELSPSLTAAVLDGLKALDDYPYDFTEPVLSRLLPNLATYQALNEFKLEDAALRTSLQAAITGSVERVVRMQNENGGWGWAAGYPSDPYISSYALFGLTRASQAGAIVDPVVLQKAQEYLITTLTAPSTESQSWELDRLAFQYYALQQAGRTDFNLDPLIGFRDKLSPWGKAFLALSLDGRNPGDERARTLISDLESSASRSATGANWQDPAPGWRNWSTPNFATAVVALAIARIDPASQVLTDAVRYLVFHRQAKGIWGSSYETAWSLLALVETVRGTGDLQASYVYSARLNESPVSEGQVNDPTQAINPVVSSVPLGSLRADGPNALTILRGDGAGRLYYRAFLRADRPAEDAPAIQHGLAVTRQYYLAGQDCRKETCVPLEMIDLANPQPVQVRLTLTVPEDMYYVMVEDHIPAGAEVLNPRLKTSQQTVAPNQPEGQGEQATYFNPQNPFMDGWGWWLFKDPLVFDDHVRWMVDYLPAGTYELTYRLSPYLAGDFRVLPAHAWQYYFPEVQGTSKGQVLTIR